MNQQWVSIWTYLISTKRTIKIFLKNQIKPILFEGNNIERGGAVKNAIDRGLLPSDSNESALNNVNISISEKNEDETGENWISSQ